jgi:hypothetical protein
MSWSTILARSGSKHLRWQGFTSFDFYHPPRRPHQVRFRPVVVQNSYSTLSWARPMTSPISLTVSQSVILTAHRLHNFLQEGEDNRRFAEPDLLRAIAGIIR